VDGIPDAVKLKFVAAGLDWGQNTPIASPLVQEAVPVPDIVVRSAGFILAINADTLIASSLLSGSQAGSLLQLNSSVAVHAQSKNRFITLTF
jgi:hypothetical protein